MSPEEEIGDVMTLLRHVSSRLRTECGASNKNRILLINDQQIFTLHSLFEGKAHHKLREATLTLICYPVRLPLFPAVPLLVHLLTPRLIGSFNYNLLMDRSGGTAEHQPLQSD